ncbi:MAG TPA: thiamine-phosphate kinase [Candidatus Omnitrophota bacterium]|nr:thiamine-phosphate kinase [Candidatus Omnitrophota bacterium]
MKELDFIKSVEKMFPARSLGLVKGIGDDCAVIEKDSRTFFVWGADMMVEGTHFTAADGYERIGRKAVAVNISDVAAMGATPKYITVSIGIPPGMSLAKAGRIYKGIRDICREYGVSLAGGDTVRSEKIVIDVSILGTVRKSGLVTRSGARPGELILITGPVRDGKREHLDFSPRIKESVFLSGKFRPSAMIDVSDGIAMDIARISDQSGTGCLLYEESIPLAEGLSPEDALYYGESFELLFTMSAEKASKLPYYSETTGLAGFFVIGEVTKASLGMRICGASGKVSKLKIKGYDHLSPGAKKGEKK